MARMEQQKIRDAAADQKVFLEELFKAIVESSDDAIYSKDPHGIIQTWNKGAERIFGYTADEVIGKPITILFSPEYVDEERKILSEVLAGKRIDHYETVRKHKDGHLIDVSLSASPIRNRAGQIIGASKIARDISEQRRQQRLMCRHYEAIIAASDDAIFSNDLQGIIQTWNKGAEKIFGYSPDEAIGTLATFLFPPENMSEEQDILAKIRTGERLAHYETIHRCKTGKLIDVSLTISPIKDSQGKVVGASNIARDVTDKKCWEAHLKDAHEEQENANRAKDNFFAVLSHELRTPLSPILLIASEAAEDPTLHPDVRKRFEMILHNVEMETSLIDDLLDLARIRSGKLKIKESRINIHKTLLDSLLLVRSLAEEKEIALVEKLQHPDSAIVGDPIRLKQIFSNVLKNAIKFTPPKGTVTVEANSTDVDCVVTISDTGIGMTPHELAIAFEAFKQGDHSKNASQFGGLGLGLAICRRLVALHSGTIEAFSKGPGRGSTFTINLPLANKNLPISK